MNIIVKYLITAAIVVAVSEAAKRMDKLGALIASLPLVTILALIWIYVESKDAESTEKLANHAWYTFWYVIPTLPMFLVVPKMLRAGQNFWLVLGTYCIGSICIFLITALILKKFGVELM